MVTLAPQGPTATPTDADIGSDETKAEVGTTSESADGAAVQNNRSMTNAGVGASLISNPIALFPVGALGLVAVVFFIRFVLAYRQRIPVHRDHSHRTDERPPHELDDDQFFQQQQLEVTDRSPNQTDSKPLRSRRIDGQRRGTVRASHPASSEPNWIKNRSQYEGRGDQRPNRPVSIDRGEPNPVKKPAQPAWHEDQQQYESVEESDDLVADLHSPHMSAPSDFPDAPVPNNDGWSHSGHRKDNADRIGEQIREREEVLETLRRDLDRLLRSPKTPVGSGF
jgi:hypothetical protein